MSLNSIVIKFYRVSQFIRFLIELKGDLPRILVKVVNKLKTRMKYFSKLIDELFAVN